MGQWWSMSDVEVFMDEKDFEMMGKEHVLTIYNHKYDVDWLMGWLMCQRIDMLGGTKVVMKNSLRHIPIMGWTCAMGEYIFLKRVWETDSKILVKDLNTICDYPEELFFSITLFCEGTRFTKEKHVASMEIAREKGMPELKHHLMPRSKGFTLLTRQLKGKVAAIYDINLGVNDVDGKRPMLSHVKNGIPLKGQIFIRRIPLESVPTENDKVNGEFLQQLYREKDEIFEVFHQHGDFSSLGVKKHILKKNKKDLYITISWLLLILLPSAYYFLGWFWTGSLAFKLCFSAFVVIVWYGVEWLIGRADSVNASNFGLANTPTSTPTKVNKEINNNLENDDHNKKNE
jgi:lysophosphatidic acid acyltransferase/lysophosphatidylinositol acyltransferase